MKLVTAVVKPFKLDEVKEAIKAVGVTGLTVSQVRGFGHTGGHIEVFRGKEYVFDFVDKLQAVCHRCGGPATLTQRLLDGHPAPFEGATVQIGALDSYEARCRVCYEPGYDAPAALTG